MGAGDRYLQPSFTVPMPASAATWPFEAKVPRPYCEKCDRPNDFCECNAPAPAGPTSRERDHEE